LPCYEEAWRAVLATAMNRFMSNPVASLVIQKAKSSLGPVCSRKMVCNEPTGGSFGRRRCRFFRRLDTNSPAAIVWMPSTAMTPIAMLARGRIHTRCCTRWRRRPLVIRLGHRQILGHGNCHQCADNQGAAYKSDIHARLRVLPQIRMPMAIASVVKMSRTPCPGQGQRQVQ
jgi:hypothetical protein